MQDDKTRVLIPTTNGTVEILLLTEEDPIIGRSVACIGGTTTTAHIGADYHAFVAKPTGIVERLFGHNTYRLDFSGPVDAGSSWQLGVLIAHALHARGQLAQEHDNASKIIWATGAVRPVDGAVTSVGHVADKIENSLEELAALAISSRSVTMLLPHANRHDVTPAAKAVLDASGITLLPIGNLDLLSKIALPLPAEPERMVPAIAGTTQPLPPRIRPGHIAIGGVGLVILLLMGVLWQLVRKPAATSPEQPADVLAATLKRVVPKASNIDRRANLYFQTPTNRALAVAPRAQTFYFTFRWESATLAEERILEKCQLAYDEPCGVIAVNDRIRSDPPAAGVVDAPRLKYSGKFDPEKIPVVRPQVTRRAAVQKYREAIGPKASALHPGGQFSVVLSATDQKGAEVQALADCNENSDKALHRPCYLYSIGDDVVLEKHATRPISGE